MSRLTTLLSTLPPLAVPQPSEPLHTFKLFPKLAPELRLKIWGYAARQPRTLLLCNTWYLEEDNPFQLQRESIENNNKIPAILHTCSKAHQEGLKSYTACPKRCSKDVSLNDQHGHKDREQPCSSKKIYINFNLDRFLRREIDNYWWVREWEYYLEENDLARIQNLDIEYEGVNLNYIGGRDIFPLLRDLQELNLVVKSCTWSRPIWPNTIERSLTMEGYEKRLMKAITWTRNGIGYGEDHWSQLPKGVEVACKWSWVVEELDLAPISAGSCAGYASAGSADEEMLRFQEETGDQNGPS
jgi:hypothetical protein